MMMLNTLHSDLRVSVVARAPAPADKGEYDGNDGRRSFGAVILEYLDVERHFDGSTNSTSAPASAKRRCRC